MNVRPQWRGPHKQRGVVAAMVVISLVAMLGIVGLALDGGHSMLNKSRLQNVVDAAALASAQILDMSDGDEALATAEAMAMFADNANETGNREIANAFAAGDIAITIEYSATLDPFVGGTTPADYVRVIATDMELQVWFISVLGLNDKRVGATAVAGPSPTLGEVCNIAPMMACGDADATDGLWGYTAGELTVLKTASNNLCPDETSTVGPGNFQLVRLDGLTGGADLREAMAGGYQNCVVSDDQTIPTEPGNTVGPVVQGLNTRLGKYMGPLSGARDEYPPDLVTDQIGPLTYNDENECKIRYQGALVSETNTLPWDYQDYTSNMLTPNQWNFYQPDGVALRRVLRIPVGDCTGTTNGQGDVPMLGVLCFFMLQEVVQKGSEAHVYGQFMGEDDSCPVTGKPGPEPITGPGPYRIQLYKDPDMEAS